MTAKEPCWFEAWFDSPYYHLLYKNRNEEEAGFFIDNLVKKLDLKKGAKILDLACGKGRHAIHLNNLGYDVTGIDLSEESISIAQKSENETLAFFVHDMRELYWANHFDCILNLFTSFGYFDDENDNLKTLQSVYDSLKPGGVFVIDFFNAAKVERELVAAEIVTADNTEFHISRQIKDGYIIKNIEVRKGETSEHFMEKVQLILPEHFQKWFTATGFEIMNVWGDYSLNEFNPETSARLIMSVKK
ncbi:MAG: dTDP-3-amino-3,4,6-trideoxy-alpha-D-glucopyranose [Bacteroidia bacterium]|nr:dTDP-3-amino-3,4,6-trideoxy-alpha-D-glucopyranose [Bacteroidia bacterium]